MSNLVRHAETELRKAGLFGADSDYGGMLAESVMRLIRVFAGEGHSGMSARMSVQLFTQLASFKTLTPPTSNPDERQEVDEVGEDMRFEKLVPVWQNRRQSSCFSNDGGKTYYDIDAGDDRAIRVAETP